jgi:uncharacterized repeat protein (TIGR03806 family)
MRNIVWLVCICCLLAACEPAPRVFEASEFPERLSDWGVLWVENNQLVLHSASSAYDLNTPLFTDYAHKLRTIWTPQGSVGAIGSDGLLELPVGSIISKTFFYSSSDGELVQTEDATNHYTASGLDMTQVHLMETRLLVRLEDGWHGLPYIWNEAQREATLEITGSVIPVNVSGLGPFNYIVPDSNQCQGCHVTDLATEALKPIGLQVRHIDKAYRYLHKTDSQLDYVAGKHHLEFNDDFSEYKTPANARWGDVAVPLEHRARSYLDINCGHCHSATGAADTSGMFLNIEESDRLAIGLCKPPIAAGQGSGGYLFGISPGNAEESILTFRMRSDDPGAMMPELGRSLVHDEGVQLVSAWINKIDWDCLAQR